MYFQLLKTLATFTIASSVVVEDWKSPQLKSFSSAQQECAVYLLLSNETVQRCESNGYPDEFICRKLINCILVQIHAFDEEVDIRDHIIKLFFDPSKVCSDYVSRTEECLRTTEPKKCEGLPFERVYRLFQCYYRNYGTLLKDKVYFLAHEPARSLRRILPVIQTLSIVNISCEVLRDFSEGRGFTIENISDALYTLGLRTGYYDLVNGVYLDRIYTHFGIPEILSESTRDCLARVSQQYQTEPLRLTQLVLQCVENYISTKTWFSQTAQLILASNSSYCNVCEPKTSCPYPASTTTETITTTHLPLTTTAKYRYPSF